MKIKHGVIAISFALLFSGCAVIEQMDESKLRLPITYGTMKVIQKDNDIGREKVLEVVDKVEGFVDANAEITADKIREYVASTEEWQEIDYPTQMLISSVFNSVEQSVRAQMDEEALPEDVKIKIYTLLDYVRTAAKMAR